jgi:hypothetical protein
VHETLLTPGHQILTALGRLIGLCRPSQLKSAHSLAVGRSSTPLRSHAAQSITVRSTVRPEFRVQSEGHSRASMRVMPEGEIVPVGLADGGSTAALLPRHVGPRYCAVQRVLLASSLFLVQPASQDGETPFRLEHRAPLRIWPKPMSHCEASSVPVLLGHIYQLHAGYDSSRTIPSIVGALVGSGQVPENCKIEWRRMYYRSNPHSATQNQRRLHRTRLRHAVGCMCRGTGPYAGW